jgi:hypothetical protein
LAGISLDRLTHALRAIILLMGGCPAGLGGRSSRRRPQGRAG